MKGLDRYLTQEPSDDRFQEYAERVADAISQNFYDSWYEWMESNQYDVLVEKLFDKGIEPTKAAAIIERTFSLYKIMYQL